MRSLIFRIFRGSCGQHCNPPEFHCPDRCCHGILD